MWFLGRKIDDQDWHDLNSKVINMTRENRLVDALVSAKELFALSKTNYGKKHVNMATALNNLGIIHSLRKEFDEAESYLLAALQISERVSGKVSKEVATVNMNLARLYTMKSKAINEAIEAAAIT